MYLPTDKNGDTFGLLAIKNRINTLEEQLKSIEDPNSKDAEAINIEIRNLKIEYEYLKKVHIDTDVGLGYGQTIDTVLDRISNSKVIVLEKENANTVINIYNNLGKLKRLCADIIELFPDIKEWINE